MKLVAAILRDTTGTVATEYAAIASLISVAALLSYLALGERVTLTFEQILSSSQNAILGQDSSQQQEAGDDFGQ